MPKKNSNKAIKQLQATAAQLGENAAGHVQRVMDTVGAGEKTSVVVVVPVIFNSSTFVFNREFGYEGGDTESES